MRILIIADAAFAGRERGMLSRLEVGLADEGIRVVHAIPRRSAHWYHADVFTQLVPYEDRGMVISRPWRARQVIRDLQTRAGGESQPIDIVHAFGAPAWPIAAELARMSGAALALEIDSAVSAAKARSAKAGAGPLYFLLPDPALERLVRGDDVGVQVRATPWGVHTPALPHDLFGNGLSVMLLAGTSNPRAVAESLEGLAAAAQACPQLMIFAEDAAVAAAGGWGLLKRLGLTDRATLVPDMEARRELTLRADVLLLPEAGGEHRSLTLDAMAAGMLVLAAADPAVSVLIDGKTARTVAKSGAAAWREAMEWVIRSPDPARALGLSAREHIRAHHRASSHVASVLGAYEWMMSGTSIPFTARPEVR